MSSTYCLKCSQRYHDPRILSCCHSFCTQCIQSLITDGAGTNSVTCPSCHQTASVPNEGVDSFPRNLYLVRKQGDKFSKINANPPLSCDSCGKNPSIAYCTECNEIICKECCNIHQILSITRNHVIYNFEDIKKMTQEEILKIFPSCRHTCQDIIDHQLEFYCHQCHVPVCINHKDHPITEVNKQVPTSIQAIKQSFHEIQIAQQQLKKVLTLGEEMKGKIQARKKYVDTFICQSFASLHQLLHQREQVLLAQNNEVASAKEACLSFQLEEIQHLLETMTYCQSLAAFALEEYNDVELLSVAHTLQTRANQLQQEFSDTPIEVCESPTISVDINTDELATNIKNLSVVYNEKVSPNNTMAEIPPRVVIGKEFKVNIVCKDNKGKVLSKGGAIVSGSLVLVEENGTPIEAEIRDCGDGTYHVLLTPQQLGQHKLSIAISGQSIQGSPFNLTIIESRDYTTLKDQIRVQVNRPASITFSNNGDIFVTSRGNWSVHVFDSSGRQKNYIGSYFSTKFRDPSGIAITGDLMYVVEHSGHRVQKLTLNGDFLDSFGSRGSDEGQFESPWGICISPDGRIFVADYRNDRIQVFHEDNTFSHIINDKTSGNVGIPMKCPACLTFDILGLIHVTSAGSNIVTVFSPEGRYIRQYGQAHLSRPHGIAIDSAGQCFVANVIGKCLAIFDQHGHYIHSIRRFKTPVDVAVSLDSSVWVADELDSFLFKYR